jgi:hypothetical protein
MPKLLFEGYRDDTFGEYRYFNDDYDNCASGEPIEYLVQDPITGNGVVVSGQYCPGNCYGWLIGVAPYEDVGFSSGSVDWPMTHRFNGTCYLLVIEAPEDVVLRCLTRESKQCQNPPLGLIPRWLAAEKRLADIEDALYRYYDAQKEPPKEWLAEREEILEYLRSHSAKTNSLKAQP